MMDEKTIKKIVERVVNEKLGDKLYPGQTVETDEGFTKVKDPSGILKIAQSTVRCEPFEQQGVALKELPKSEKQQPSTLLHRQEKTQLQRCQR